MAQKIRPLGDNVLVEIDKQAERQTESGLYIPQTATQDGPKMGKVVAFGEKKSVEDDDCCGSGCGNDKGTDVVVEVGQIVIFGRYAGTEVKMDGKEYCIIKRRDILAVVE